MASIKVIEKRIENEGSEESEESEESTESEESEENEYSNFEPKKETKEQIKYRKHLIRIAVGDGRVLGNTFAKEGFFSGQKDYAFLCDSSSNSLVTLRPCVLSDNGNELNSIAIKTSTDENENENENEKADLSIGVKYGDRVSILHTANHMTSDGKTAINVPFLSVDPKEFLVWENSDYQQQRNNQFTITPKKGCCYKAPLSFGDGFHLSFKDTDGEPLYIVADHNGYLTTTGALSLATELFALIPGTIPKYQYVNIKQQSLNVPVIPF